MDVARLNFSHGTHEEHGGRLARLREATELERKSVAVLQDLCGPKIRTGTFPRKFDLPTGIEVTLVEGEASADERVIPIQYEGLARDVRVGRPHPVRRRSHRPHGLERRGRARQGARRAGRRHARPRRRPPAEQDDAHLARSPRRTRTTSSSASRAASTTSRSPSCAAPRTSGSSARSARRGARRRRSSRRSRRPTRSRTSRASSPRPTA